MELSTILALLGILMLIGAFVSYPFIMALRLPQIEDQDRSILLADRERLIATLNELDFDHQLGKILEEDFISRRNQLIAMGAGIMAKLATTPGEVNDLTKPSTYGNLEAMTDEEIETLITKRRKNHTEQKDEFCPQCGKAILHTDLFCPGCGHKLKNP